MAKNQDLVTTHNAQSLLSDSHLFQSTSKPVHCDSLERWIRATSMVRVQARACPELVHSIEWVCRGSLRPRGPGQLIAGTAAPVATVWPVASFAYYSAHAPRDDWHSVSLSESGTKLRDEHLWVPVAVAAPSRRMPEQVRGRRSTPRGGRSRNIGAA